MRRMIRSAMFIGSVALGVMASAMPATAASTESYCEYDWCWGFDCKDSGSAAYNCALNTGTCTTLGYSVE